MCCQNEEKVPMGIHSLCQSLFLLSFLLIHGGFCAADDTTSFQVVGSAECADCDQNNLMQNQAFSGLRVSIDCKFADGEIKRLGDGELDSSGSFNVVLAEEVSDKQHCFAQLYSAAAAPCRVPAAEVVLKSPADGKQRVGVAGKMKFSSALCASEFSWPPLPKLPPWKKTFPKFPLPPLKDFGHGHPWFNHPIPPFFLHQPPSPIPQPPPPAVPKPPIYNPPPVPNPYPPSPPNSQPPPIPYPSPPSPPTSQPPPIPKPSPPSPPISKPPPVPKPSPPSPPISKPPPYPQQSPPPVPICEPPTSNAPPPAPVVPPFHHHHSFPNFGFPSSHPLLPPFPRIPFPRHRHTFPRFALPPYPKLGFFTPPSVPRA